MAALAVTAILVALVGWLGLARAPMLEAERPVLRQATEREASARPASARPASVQPASVRPVAQVAVGCPGAPERHDKAFLAAARHLPLALGDSGPVWLAAQDCVESHWRRDAVSEVGAAGVPQLMVATARDLGLSPEDRFAPKPAIAAGARYMTWCMDRFTAYPSRTARDFWELALACYNAGLGGVLAAQERCGGLFVDDLISCLPEETANYVLRWRMIVFGTSEGPRATT